MYNGYNFNNYQLPNYQYGQLNQMQPQPTIPASYLNGKIVDSVDVVKAMDVPIGGYGIYPKADLSEIYIKSWNPNGTTNIVTFKPIVPETVAPAQEESQGNMVQLFQKIELLESKLDAFIAENKMTGMTSGVMKKEVNASGF